MSSFVTTAALALARLVASSATFQGLTNAAFSDGATAAAALTHVYWPEADDRPDPDNPPAVMDARPRAVVTDGDQLSGSRRGVGEWIHNGSLFLTIELLLPATNVYYATDGNGNLTSEVLARPAQEWFNNQWGAIVSEMEANSGLGSAGSEYLNQSEWELIGGPGPSIADQEAQPHFGVVLKVSWP